MTNDTPIACSLTAAELPARLAAMTEIGFTARLDAETTSTHAELRFQPTADTRERLTAIVAAEANCCAFLRFELHQASDAIVLTIDAPEDPAATLVLHDLVDAFAPTTGTTA